MKRLNAEPYTRKDANHHLIARTYEKLGCSVVDVSALRGGIGDLLVGMRRFSWLVEVKNPQRRWTFTPAEEEFRRLWRGRYRVVATLEDVLADVRDVQSLADLLRTRCEPTEG